MLWYSLVEASEAAVEAATEAAEASEEDEEEEEEEPEEVRQAWDELLLIQREQQRYSDIKYDLEQDLEQCKKKQTKLEDVIFSIVVFSYNSPAGVQISFVPACQYA